MGRTYSPVVLTNPEHGATGRVCNGANWSTFLRRLRFVVMTRAKPIAGFGSNVAHVKRRLVGLRALRTSRSS